MTVDGLNLGDKMIVDSSSDLDLIRTIIEYGLNGLTVLNSYKIGGFGLLEILIAFAVLSIVVPLLFRLLGYESGGE